MSMPYEYDEQTHLIPVCMAGPKESEDWIPLQRCKDASNYFQNYCIGTYRYDQTTEKWSFDVDDEKEQSSFWGIQMNNFVCQVRDADEDGVFDKHYYVWVSKENTLIIGIFIKNTIGLSSACEWSDFEETCLKPAMVFVAHNYPTQTMDWAKNDEHMVSLLPLGDFANDKYAELRKKCMEHICAHKDFAYFISSLRNVYFLHQDDVILAYILVRVEKFGDWNLAIAEKIECLSTYDKCHKLMDAVSTHLQTPIIPRQLANNKQEKKYWTKHFGHLILTATRCVGIDFFAFLDSQIDDFRVFFHFIYYPSKYAVDNFEDWM